MCESKPELTADDVIEARVHCWVCMRREVSAIGEKCRVCTAREAIGAGERFRQQTKHMTLDQLIRTRKSGWVPEDQDFYDNETVVDPDLL